MSKIMVKINTVYLHSKRRRSINGKHGHLFDFPFLRCFTFLIILYRRMSSIGKKTMTKCKCKELYKNTVGSHKHECLLKNNTTNSTSLNQDICKIQTTMLEPIQTIIGISVGKTILQ